MKTTNLPPRTIGVVRAEYNRVKKLLNAPETSQKDNNHLYGAQQALAWVLRDNAMRASKCFALVEGR